MNTADRSLAMVDYALRRRFRFLTLRPAFDTGVFGQWLTQRGASQPLVARIVDRMRSLNESIAADTKNLGPGYEIGHSFFCPRNGETLDDTWYQKIVEHEIVPLIQEYWFDDDGKVEEARQMLLL
jgi:5-methylcytosine-specific restriction protein B